VSIIKKYYVDHFDCKVCGEKKAHYTMKNSRECNRANSHTRLIFCDGCNTVKIQFRRDRGEEWHF
jgi:hypothetical protein